MVVFPEQDIIQGVPSLLVICRQGGDILASITICALPTQSGVSFPQHVFHVMAFLAIVHHTRKGKKKYNQTCPGRIIFLSFLTFISRPVFRRERSCSTSGGFSGFGYTHAGGKKKTLILLNESRVKKNETCL
jgi:hypothetical protein